MCPNSGPYDNRTWWCGTSNATPCATTDLETSPLASFIQIVPGTLLGLAPLTPSTRAQSAATSTAVPVSTSNSAANPTSTASAIAIGAKSSQTPRSTAATATAIGAGVGVPLGLAVVGLLGFLFWRESRRKERVAPYQAVNDDKSSTDQVVQWRNDQGQTNELADNQLPSQADHAAVKVELETNSRVGYP